MLANRRCFVLNLSVRNPEGRFIKSWMRLGIVATKEASRRLSLNSLTKTGMSATWMRK